MRQPEATKNNILKQSGLLFNTQGYKATSLTDITEATKLTKGAIYRHFKSKHHLEKEALNFLSQIMFREMRDRIKSEATAPQKLRALFGFFETYITKAPIKGGCPLLNVSIEADDAHPILRKKAVSILDLLQQSIETLLANGIKHGQLKPGLDGKYYSSLMIAMIEGSIMMSKLRGNNEDIRNMIRHLNGMIKEIER